MDEKIYPDIVVHVRALLSHTLIDQSNVDKEILSLFVVHIYVLCHRYRDQFSERIIEYRYVGRREMKKKNIMILSVFFLHYHILHTLAINPATIPVHVPFM